MSNGFTIPSFLINDMVWSYSRLKAYEDCPYRWYLKYILDYKEDDMFYASYGSFMHELLAQYYSRELTKDELPIRFLESFQYRVLGERPASSTVEKYIKAGVAYLSSFKPFDMNTLGVEEKVEFDIDGVNFIGFVDYVGEKDGEIYIVDHKSHDLKPRSKRKKPTQNDVEIDEMLKQLYLYSKPIKEKYGTFPTKLCFNCFKAGVVIEEPFSEAEYDNTIQWATGIINDIKNEIDFNPYIEFFKCKNICGCHDECCYWKGGD